MYVMRLLFLFCESTRSFRLPSFISTFHVTQFRNAHCTKYACTSLHGPSVCNERHCFSNRYLCMRPTDVNADVLLESERFAKRLSDDVANAKSSLAISSTSQKNKFSFVCLLEKSTFLKNFHFYFIFSLPRVIFSHFLFRHKW